MRSQIFDTYTFDELFTDFFSVKESKSQDLIVELEDSFEITVDLPGVSKSDIDIQVDNEYLTIKATKKPSEVKGKILYSSRQPTNFNKSYKLGSAVDIDSIKAECADGVLIIKVGKKESSKARKIEIT